MLPEPNATGLLGTGPSLRRANERSRHADPPTLKQPVLEMLRCKEPREPLPLALSVEATTILAHRDTLVSQHEATTSTCFFGAAVRAMLHELRFLVDETPAATMERADARPLRLTSDR